MTESQVIIEATGSGIALIDYYFGSPLFRVRHRKPKDDKATRMMAETPEIERGAVFLPKGAPWLETFHDEVVRFPKGKHDDIVDSLSQYCRPSGGRFSARLRPAVRAVNF